MAQPVHDYLATETAKTFPSNFHLLCKSKLDGRTGIFELNTSKKGCDISHCIMISYLKQSCMCYKLILWWVNKTCSMA